MKKNPIIYITGILVVLTIGIGWISIQKYLQTFNQKQPTIDLNSQSLQTTPKAASTDNMVLIAAGSFAMGREPREGWSPMANPLLFNDELPSHKVYVDAFYIDKYEVTNRQFKEFVDATGYITNAKDHGASMVVVSADISETPIQGTDIGWKLVAGAT